MTWGWRDTGIYGNAGIRTPNIDWLARSGLRVQWAFGTTPQCSPSRISTLTGRYAHATRTEDLHDPHRPYHRGRYDPAPLPGSREVPPYLADTPETRADLALYYDAIARMDGDIGQMMVELDRRMLLENTLVVFLSDNGPPFPREKGTQPACSIGTLGPTRPDLVLHCNQRTLPRVEQRASLDYSKPSCRRKRMRRFLGGGAGGPNPNLAALLLSLGLIGGCRTEVQPRSEDQLPQLTRDGSLKQPKDWETWVMVGSSTGLSYTAPGAAPAAGAAPGMFHNVYMQPWAYREFTRTGAFPEGTMFVLSFYEASRKSAPAKAGFYEGDRMPGIEIHLKRTGLDSTGWGFFTFGDTASLGTKLPGSAACYSCHATEAAHDNVFTQFYPFMRERLAKASARTGGR